MRHFETSFKQFEIRMEKTSFANYGLFQNVAKIFHNVAKIDSTSMTSDPTSPEVIENDSKTAGTHRDHSSSTGNRVRRTRRSDINCHPNDTRPFENDALRPSTIHDGGGVYEASGRQNIFLSLQMTDDRT